MATVWHDQEIGILDGRVEKIVDAVYPDPKLEIKSKNCQICEHVLLCT